MIIDLATLTGACVTALGYFAAGMVGSNQKLMEELKKAGERTGERVWEMPFWDDYKQLVKGDIADLNNVSKTGGKFGPGMIFGGAFLQHFVEKTPWVHLDIAGTAWWNSEGDYVPKGGTGWGVRLLIDWLKGSKS